MNRTYVVTGAASGIGATTTRYLRERGGRVIGCDLRNADVIANLTTGEGVPSWSTASHACLAVGSTRSLQMPVAVQQRPASR